MVYTSKSTDSNSIYYTMENYYLRIHSIILNNFGIREERGGIDYTTYWSGRMHTLGLFLLLFTPCWKPEELSKCRFPISWTRHSSSKSNWTIVVVRNQTYRAWLAGIAENKQQDIDDDDFIRHFFLRQMGNVHQIPSTLLEFLSFFRSHRTHHIADR